MHRVWQLFFVPLLLFAGCETRRSHLEAVNEYRACAPELAQLKAEQKKLKAKYAYTVKHPVRLWRPQPGLAYKAPAGAMLGEPNAELQERELQEIDASIKDVTREIAELEPKVNALKARLGANADSYLEQSD